MIVSSEETYFRDKISDDYLGDLKLSLNDIQLCSKKAPLPQNHKHGMKNRV